MPRHQLYAGRRTQSAVDAVSVAGAVRPTALNCNSLARIRHDRARPVRLPRRVIANDQVMIGSTMTSPEAAGLSTLRRRSTLIASVCVRLHPSWLPPPPPPPPGGRVFKGSAGD